MRRKNLKTVRELLYNSYANLAMAHTAVDRKQEKYGTFNYMIRAKLLKGLSNGTMNMRTIFDDEKIKIQTGSICNYCGSSENLTMDHIFPKHSGGEDVAENLVVACRTCNSSKGKKDLMEWMHNREHFLPLSIIRRYLKLAFYYSYENNLLDERIEDLKVLSLPFKIEFIPIKYPLPNKLIMTYKEKK